MRKLFVALLILSVMGGAFAQEGSWGDLTGEVELSTKIDFFGNHARDDAWEATMAGAVGTLEFNIEYTNQIGPFSLTLPLRLKEGVFGTDVDDDGNTTANLAYTNGALKVEIPFTFNYVTAAAAGGAAGVTYVPNTGDYYPAIRAAIDKYDLYLEAGDKISNMVEFWNSNGTDTVGDLDLLTLLDLDSTKDAILITNIGSASGKSVQVLHAYKLNDEYDHNEYLATILESAGGTCTDEKYTGNPYNVSKYEVVPGGAAAAAGSGGQNFAGLAPMASGNADLSVEYDDETFGFIFGVKDIFTDPAIGNVGGYYHFMGGQSQLYVSRGAYETKWWRASDYVLEPSLDFIGIHGSKDKGFQAVQASTDGNIFKYIDYLFTRGDIFNPDDNPAGKFRWENIETNGIAYRYFVVPEVLNIGIAITADGLDNSTTPAEESWAPPFYNSTPEPKTTSKQAGLFGSHFLLHTTFGAAYEDGPLAVSFMLGLQDAGKASKINAKEDDKDLQFIDIHTALGASFEVMEGLKIRGDMMAVFPGSNTDYEDMFTTNDDGDKVTFTPNLNLGAVITYDSDTLIAGFGIKGLNIITPYKSDMSFLGLEFMAGFNIARDGDFGFGDPNDGFWAKLSGSLSAANYKEPDDDDFRFNSSSFGLNIGLGYQGLELSDKLKLGVSANLGVDILTSKMLKETNGRFYVSEETYYPYAFNQGEDYDSESVSRITFSIKPELTWSVFENGSIVLAYELGSRDAEVGRMLIVNKGNNNIFSINQLSAAFKWSF